VFVVVAGPEETKNFSWGKCPPPDSDPFNEVESEKNPASLSRRFAASTNHRFEFQKRRQIFIRAHNETPSVVGMLISNPDFSPAGINP
jgi:hypothetical protein